MWVDIFPTILAFIAQLVAVSHEYLTAPSTYTRMMHPLPALVHSKYPFYTLGGGDRRWKNLGEADGEGLEWVGSLMSVASYFFFLVGV